MQPAVHGAFSPAAVVVGTGSACRSRSVAHTLSNVITSSVDSKCNRSAVAASSSASSASAGSRAMARRSAAAASPNAFALSFARPSVRKPNAHSGSSSVAFVAAAAAPSASSISNRHWARPSKALLHGRVPEATRKSAAAATHSPASACALAAAISAAASSGEVLLPGPSTGVVTVQPSCIHWRAIS